MRACRLVPPPETRTAIFAFAFDVISKQIAITDLKEYESIPLIDHFFSLTLVHNDGVAFSMLNGMRVGIILLTICIICFLIYYVIRCGRNSLEMIGFSLMIGGALGNLLDRILYGYVIDFLDFCFLGWDYPIFNFADCFVVIGIFLVIVYEIMKRGNTI